MIGRQRMQYSMRSNNNIGVRDPEVISGKCTTMYNITQKSSSTTVTIVWIFP